MKTSVTVIALLLLVSLGCSPSQQAKARTAVDVAAYNAELDACVERGKAANSKAVYEACAQDADRKFGRVQK